MADHLSFEDLQATTFSGDVLSEFTVEAHQVNHAVDTGYRTNITISISSGGGTLGGTTTQSCSSGVSTFSDITLTGSDGARVLTASSGDLEAPSGAELGSISIVSAASGAPPSAGISGAVAGMTCPPRAP